MKKSYFIIGRWVDLMAAVPHVTGDIHGLEENLLAFTNEEYEYLHKTFPSGRTVAIELNVKTGEQLILRPLEQVVGTGLLQAGWEDFLLDYISDVQKQRGYFPIREIDLPVESEII